MHALNTTAAGRAAIIVERGLEQLGRRSIAKALGWTEREARSALECLRSGNPEPAQAPASPPQPIDPVLATPPTATFAKRRDVTDLSNWRDGWTRECLEPELITDTDAKGNTRTRKVIHDPGIVWPEGWTGPKSHADLYIEAKPSRPVKWGMLVSSAQAITPVHGPALMAMSALCGYRNLSLVFLGVEQKITGAASKTDEVAEWSSAIDGYVTTEKHDFGGVVIDGAFPMKPTLEAPLDGLAAYCDGRHHVFGSMRQDMITLMRFKDDPQAFARCTGTVTVPNYSRSKAGMVAIENHVLGGVIVECDLDDNIFLRNVQCHPLTGELWDLDVVVEKGVVRDAATVRGERGLKRPVLGVGCVHAKWANKDCLRAIFGIGGKPAGDMPLVDVIDPSEQVLHDVFDAHSVSPYDRKHPMMRLRKRIKGDDDVAAELKLTADLIAAMGSSRRNTWLVESNHDRHFDRALLEKEWKNDITNAKTLLRVNLANLEAVEAGDDRFSPLAYALRMMNPEAKFKTSRFGDPLCFFRYYYHCHGDRGTNGSSGASLANTGFYLAMAHIHAVQQRRRAIWMGCIIDPPPHAEGPGNMGHCVGIEHPDGSYQLIPIVNGKWRP